MKKELIKSIYEVNFKGKELLVTIFEHDLKKIKSLNWKWESLLFPDNLCNLVYIEEKNTKNVLNLITHGYVRILNKKDLSDVSLDEIKQLSMNNEIYDENKFQIIYNNWFSIDFGYKENDVITLLDDYVFESEPKSKDQLIEILINSFYDYFYSNN